VWNVGTGYFGCGTTSSINGGRVFDESSFRETIHENTTIRMIELKVSQGAKPGHGGILPKSKITPEIAAARKLTYPPTFDCHSPPNHSAFSDHRGLIEFVSRLREYSGGMPVGIKLCVGDPRDVACLVRAMIDVGTGPDFITVDGGEGGTGAAPPEYSDSVGMPLEEGLVVVRNLLIGAGLRSKVRIVASGKVTNGFSLVRTLALGADATCAARAFMLSLGCIQALKCNTNRCPTGIATQDRDLQYGLDPAEKSHRVYNFHRKTMDAAAEIVGTIGHDRFSDLSGECVFCYFPEMHGSYFVFLEMIVSGRTLSHQIPLATANDIMRRISDVEVKTLEDYLPSVEPESLLKGCAPRNLQKIWDGTATGAKRSEIRWIY
jgi:glutamate synthase domain-containing protein 2